MAEEADVTVTSKNMIVIPKAARERFKIKEGNRLHVFVEDNEIRIVPLLTLKELRGRLKGGLSMKELMKEARRNVSRFD